MRLPSPGDVRRAAVRNLEPAYFAMVMATGIISVDTRAMGLKVPSAVLLWVGIAGYAVLLVLSGWRLLGCRAETARDLGDPAKAFGFFTFVAATDLLGTRIAMDGRLGVATVFLVVGALSWLVLAYLVPWASVLRHESVKALARANGTWFVWVVGGQSVAILAATLERAGAGPRDALALFAVAVWSISMWLYLLVGVVVCFRLMLFEMDADELNPPYWVAMGANAISVVAAAKIAGMREAPAAEVVHDFALHVGVVFWGFATWVFFALLLAGWWRHVRRGVPLRYGPGMWSLVFPLGTYAAASHGLGEATGLGLVTAFGDVEVWFGLAAWVLTFCAMAVHLARAARSLTRSPG
ncbi:tellurite resistance/C4-dicarboxylate transporter family protein [Streptosporangium jomthongense]|uniref:Tellurite resistance/C4-dicarboxylate transporter family protein n=1 Tax=Streptosporangium jomthongense TaxID=1193683 RepID=A0ABV8EX70_9ACTN